MLIVYRIHTAIDFTRWAFPSFDLAKSMHYRYRPPRTLEDPTLKRRGPDPGSHQRVRMVHPTGADSLGLE